MLNNVLTLEEVGPLHYRAHHHIESFRKTLFGGQALGQALMAAGHTTDRRPVHSLHGYFLTAGQIDAPIDYHVDILRDGRSFLTRQVKAIQNNTCIFTMMASFHSVEQGYEHHAPVPEGRILPETLKATSNTTQDKHLSNHPKGVEVESIELIAENQSLFSTSVTEDDHARFWMRIKKDLPKDPLVHTCALAIASDLGLLASSLLNHDTSLFAGKVFPASLDHAIWFHGPVNMNEFVEYITESPWAGNARGFTRGTLYHRDGTMIANTTQEGLIRPI